MTSGIFFHSSNLSMVYEDFSVEILQANFALNHLRASSLTSALKLQLGLSTPIHCQPTTHSYRRALSPTLTVNMPPKEPKAKKAKVCTTAGEPGGSNACVLIVH